MIIARELYLAGLYVVPAEYRMSPPNINSTLHGCPVAQSAIPVARDSIPLNQNAILVAKNAALSLRIKSLWLRKQPYATPLVQNGVPAAQIQPL